MVAEPGSAALFTCKRSWPILIGLLGALSAHGQGTPLSIALFYDPAFVDTSTGPNPHGGAGEALNLLNSLEGYGHTVTPFTGIALSDFENASNGADLLAFPELDVPLYDALDRDTVVLIAEYVCHGGGMLIMGSHHTTDFLDRTFGYSLGGVEQPTITYLRQEDTLPEIFADGPATLPDPSLTQGIVRRRLPATAISIYDNGRNTTVAAFYQGMGRILYSGFDWFGTPPANWDAVLERMVRHAAEAGDEPESSAVTVTTLLDTEDGGDPRSVTALLADPGTDGISLREAIVAVNNTRCANTIIFNVDGRILLPEELPPLSDLTGGTVLTAEGGITIDGAALAAGEAGLTVESPANTVSGLTIVGFPGDGIRISGAQAVNNVVAGCFIGLDGDSPAPNAGHGVAIIAGARDNLVGGPMAAYANQIAANAGNGVLVSGASTLRNTIQRNAIRDNGLAGIALEEGGNGALPAPIFIADRSPAGQATAGGIVELFVDQADEGATWIESVVADVVGDFAGEGEG
jgi:hypothetical protein